MPADLNKRLQRLALTDPIVAQYVTAHARGTWTREEMLVECILTMAERYTETHAKLVQLLSEMPPRPLHIGGITFMRKAGK